jgi:hypothetical protein
MRVSLIAAKTSTGQPTKDVKVGPADVVMNLCILDGNASFFGATETAEKIKPGFISDKKVVFRSNGETNQVNAVTKNVWLSLKGWDLSTRREHRKATPFKCAP